jgi:hypothetical protein
MTYFNEADIDYYGLSAIWLNFNFSILSIGFFLNLNTLSNLSHVMKTYMKNQGEALKNDRSNPISEELDAQRNDNDWFPTKHEIVDLCTIGKINNKKMMQAFGGGFQAAFKDSSRKARNCTNMILFVLYCGSFFGYSYSDYVWNTTRVEVISE